jgi:glycosyltransferase involved in cell wall biosynthesis
MSSRHCIVIPHYRHHRPLATLIGELQDNGLPIFIVDDASGTESLRAVRKIVCRQEKIRLIIRDRNGGKGAAMMTGLRYAWDQGFSHVISLDADGQHDPGDVAVLLRLSRASPESFFSGRPQFGSEVPAARLHGRKITNYLVQVEAGSREIKDAMCGLRVYPLEAVLPLCARIGYRTRMEFDVEILVRACWAGHPIRYLDTQVTYPRGGESHFNMLRDNVRLTVMHVLLLGGGVLRLPERLWHARH